MTVLLARPAGHSGAEAVTESEPSNPTAAGGRRRRGAGILLALAVVTAISLLALPPPRADAYVYWIQKSYDQNAQSYVGRANLDGSSVKRHFIPTGTSAACGLFTDETYVYWGGAQETLVGDTVVESHDVIGRANRDGSGVNPAFMGAAVPPTGPTPQNSVGSVCGGEVLGPYLYWSSGTSAALTFTGSIGRANRDGSGAALDFIVPGGSPSGLAVTPTTIYWGDHSRIGRANLDGSGVDPNFITGTEGVMSVAVSGNHIYWADPGIGKDGAIGRARLDGSAADPTFLARAFNPMQVAILGKHLYYTELWKAHPQSDRLGRRITRATLNGKKPRSLVTGLEAGIGLAVDGLGPARRPRG